MGLFDIFGTGDQQNAANAQIAGIQAGQTQLNQDIQQGNNALTTNYGAALQPFMQNLGTANAGVGNLTNLLGITSPAAGTYGGGGGGPGASVPGSVLASLQGTPGYQFALNQGNNAINAADAANGTLNSGNQLLDLSKFNQGLAGTTYQNAVNNLMPFLQSSNTNAAGAGAVNTGLGNAINANQNTLGNAAYGANTSIGNANANADLAGLTASQNDIGALGGALKFGASIAPFLMMSDVRVKEDIEPVGQTFDGQNLYKYRYKGSTTPHIGLMAQEVETRDPDAVVEIGGIKHVNYERATRFARDLGRFM